MVAAAVIGGIGTRPRSRWYVGLDKPAWEPPANVFGPVWTGLYALIAGERPRLAMAEIVLLGGVHPRPASAATGRRPAAHRLVAPYAAWNGFATALNAAIVHRN